MAWWKRTAEDQPPVDASVDEHLRLLERADTVAFGAVGIAAKVLPATDAYFAMEERVNQYGAALRPQLDRLFERASPAGRIYAAELITRVDRAAGEAAWRRLANDGAEVTTFSGCFINQTTVARYAADRLHQQPE
jgi:hypothetical protein